jgi:(1->4)-alpha-D-glucan 1-alpha-D-glucosylmutase
LQVRKECALVFQQGRYLPLKVNGSKSTHICAFARIYKDHSIIVAVPRLCATLLGEDFDSPCHESLWGDTAVEFPFAENQCYQNVFTGSCTPITRGDQQAFFLASRLFTDFPVALLIKKSSPD